MPEYKLLESQQLAVGGFLSFWEEGFLTPDGEEMVRYAVRHPGAVVAAPIVPGPDGAPAALCVRQFRSAVRKTLLELPAGKLDVEGEDPDDAIVRELAEEISYRPAKLEKLATFFNSPGFCTELTHVYIALDLEPCEPPGPAKDEERHMTIETVPLTDVARLVKAGEIVDAKTIVGLMMAAQHLAGEAT